MLAPVVLVLCVIGAYALNNTMQSVYVLLLFGVFGYALVKLGFPLAPLILGLILGDQIEIKPRRLLKGRFPAVAFPPPADLGAAPRHGGRIDRTVDLAAPCGRKRSPRPKAPRISR